jgi:signal transduction histidine kinase
MRWLAFSKMAWGLALATLAAITLIGINEAGYRRSSEALEEVRDAQKMRMALTALMQNVLDAETGERGYLLTGNPRYLQPYGKALTEIDRYLADLQTLYADRADENARVGIIGKNVVQKLAEMDMAIRMKRDGNGEALKFVMTTEVGLEQMNTLRARIDSLVQDNSRAIAREQAQIESALQWGRTGILVVAGAALVAFWLYMRQAHMLESAGKRQQEALQRERNVLESQVSERTTSLKELASHLQEVRETERGYLARELHDELGSLLTAAKLDVARLKSRLADSPEAIQRLQHLTDLLNSGIALKRRIIEDLRPSSLPNLGLVASLEILGREFADQSGLQVEMMLEPIDTDEARQLTIYRMVQEGLTNIAKHAKATEATVVMKDYRNHVIVEVSDNGEGFDPLHVDSSTHGLAGMRHRVETARGRLTVDSTIGRGTKLEAMLPLKNPVPNA